MISLSLSRCLRTSCRLVCLRGHYSRLGISTLWLDAEVAGWRICSGSLCEVVKIPDNDSKKKAWLGFVEMASRWPSNEVRRAIQRNA